MRLLLTAIVLFAGTAFADGICGPNGTFHGIGNAGDVLCTGKVGVAAYSAPFTSASTLTVTADTHGQGLLPTGVCYDDGTPKLTIALTAGYPQTAANGDITFTWTGTKSGTCLITSLGSVKGDTGLTGSTGVQGVKGDTGLAGPASAWGSIPGSLSAQTDLGLALGLKPGMSTSSDATKIAALFTDLIAKAVGKYCLASDGLGGLTVTDVGCPGSGGTVGSTTLSGLTNTSLASLTNAALLALGN